MIPLSERFNEERDDIRFRIEGEEETAPNEEITQAVLTQLQSAGIEVVRATDEMVAEELEKKESLFDTGIEDESSLKVPAISINDDAKVLKNIDNAIKGYEKLGTDTRNFIGNIAKIFDIQKTGKSKYITIEAKNGNVVTLRISDHNATVSNFDNNEERNGISIVVSRKPNGGINNDGAANIVEYFYHDKELNKAYGNPLVEILKSIKQTLYSGEYKDTTGIAERQEVNDGDVATFMIDYHRNDELAKNEYQPIIDYISKETGIEFKKNDNSNSWYGTYNGNPIRISNHPSKFVERMRERGYHPMSFDFITDKNAIVRKIKGDNLFENYKEGDKLTHRYNKIGQVRFISYDSNKEAVTVELKDGTVHTYFEEVFTNASSKNNFTYFRTPDGTVYGWTKGGKIYVTKAGLNPNTLIHEYTHLWDKGVRQKNLELWRRGVELMKQTSLWQDVVNDPNYADLKTDDQIASEVHSHLTGKNGATLLKRLQDEANKATTLQQKFEKDRPHFKIKEVA